ASVAHQPASLGIFTPRIGGGHRKSHRLKGQLDTLARKSLEGPIDLAACTGVKDLDLQLALARRESHGDQAPHPLPKRHRSRHLASLALAAYIDCGLRFWHLSSPH